MNDKQKILKVASIILHYPDSTWLKHLNEIEKEIKLLKDSIERKSLIEFINVLKQYSFDELELLYVNTFDFNEKTSLNLTHSQYGNQKERGQGLANLKSEYHKYGYIENMKELPDFYPLMLEFAAIASKESLENTLGLYHHAIEKLITELESINNPYVKVIKASHSAANALLQSEIAGGIS